MPRRMRRARSRRGRESGQDPGRPGVSAQPGKTLHQGALQHRAPVQPEPPQIPDEEGREKGAGGLETDLLGRGPGHHRRQDPGDPKRTWSRVRSHRHRYRPPPLPSRAALCQCAGDAQLVRTRDRAVLHPSNPHRPDDLRGPSRLRLLRRGEPGMRSGLGAQSRGVRAGRGDPVRCPEVHEQGHKTDRHRSQGDGACKKGRDLAPDSARYR